MKVAAQNQMMNIAAKLHGGRDALKAKFGVNLNKGRVSNAAHRVNLSAKARRLGNLTNPARLTPEGRAERIEEFKENINDSRLGAGGVRAAGYLMRSAVDFYKSHAHPL